MLTELISAAQADSSIELAHWVNRRDASDHEPAVRQLHEYARLSNLPFWCLANDESGPRVIASTVDELEELPLMVFDDPHSVKGPGVWALESGLTLYALPLPAVGETRLVAVGCIRSRPDVCPPDFVLAAAEAGWSQLELDEWLSRQPFAAAALVERLIEAIWAQVSAESREKELRTELFAVGEQIDQTYEEITLLHSLTGNLSVSRSPLELGDLCLGRVRELTQSAGAALWFEEASGTMHYLTTGDLPFSEQGLTRLCANFAAGEWKRPLVKNRVEGTVLGREFPGLRNFVLCPIGDQSRRFGWLVNCNTAGREFGSVEASLLQSIAAILGTHLHNRDLYLQNEGLLMSFVHSMVSTIDAKDSYTRGHSERVALVARCLGEELGLPTAELSDLYLSGLLHDIGKIGVDDRILRKTDRLEPEEFEQIKLHPLIGYQILCGLKNLQRVLPGVRNHHEAFDGSGYPDGLNGEAIPLMARVLAVADAYDAMGSDRPYRGGMPLERIEVIFRENRGPQWDPRILGAYFRISPQVRRLWSGHHPADLTTSASDSKLGLSQLAFRN